MDVVTIQPESSKDISVKSTQIEDALNQYLGGVSYMVVKQNTELVEEASRIMTLGCLKIETENKVMQDEYFFSVKHFVFCVRFFDSLFNFSMIS